MLLISFAIENLQGASFVSKLYYLLKIRLQRRNYFCLMGHSHSTKAKFVEKKNIFKPLMRRCLSAYQEVQNILRGLLPNSAFSIK